MLPPVISATFGMVLTQSQQRTPIASNCPDLNAPDMDGLADHEVTLRLCNQSGRRIRGDGQTACPLAKAHTPPDIQADTDTEPYPLLVVTMALSTHSKDLHVRCTASRIEILGFQPRSRMRFVSSSVNRLSPAHDLPVYTRRGFTFISSQIQVSDSFTLTT